MNTTMLPHVGQRALSIWQIMAAARIHRAGGPGPKATLMALTERMGEHSGEWCCWPSQDQLADDTEQSLRTVRSQIAGFVAQGIVAIQPRYGEAGRQSNAYVLNPEWVLTTLGSVEANPSSTGSVEANSGGGGGRLLPPEVPEKSQRESLSDSLATPRASSIRGDDYPPAFERCWQAYPKARRGGKKAAYGAWRASVVREIDGGMARGEVLNMLHRATEAYANQRRGQDDTFTKLAQTFWGPGEHYKAVDQTVTRPRNELTDPEPAWMRGGTL